MKRVGRTVFVQLPQGIAVVDFASEQEAEAWMAMVEKYERRIAAACWN